MDRGTVLLQTLCGQLRGWADPIRRATYATSVDFLPGKDGEFTLRVVWPSREDGPQHYDKEFTRPEVFGVSYAGSPLAWRVQRRACDYARDVMREVLAARGAL
jgi:hypothetical protein